MSARTLVYFYRRRLRVHGAQELLAGLGVAIAVALVFAVQVANGSLAGSATAVVHTVVGPSDLQIRARDSDGFDARLLTRVKALRGVKQAAAILEQSATVVGPDGRRSAVDVAGADISLAVLDGLAHTLPITTLSPGGIGLSTATAAQLGVGVSDSRPSQVSLRLRGRAIPLHVSAVLGQEAAGALSQAALGLMPLARLQRFAGLPGRVTRILVQTKPGQEATVHKQLNALVGNHLVVAPANQDIALLHEALGPSNLASELFAAVALMLGLLFAVNAILLTVPERRQVIASLRLDGTRSTAIVQMVMFEALCLGVIASAIGVAAGYALSIGVFRASSGYLVQAFTLGSSTVVGSTPLLLSALGGIFATCLASTVPLFDLRRGRALDNVYLTEGTPGNALDHKTQRRLVLASGSLTAFTIATLALKPSLVLIAIGALALATVLAVPLMFAAVLRATGALAHRYERLTILPVAITSLSATTLRSLVLAATGAVALFGSVALGGSRDDLLRGISRFTSDYVSGADIWIANPQDNQAVNNFTSDDRAAQIIRIPGVVRISAYQGSFLNVNNRRVWIIAWPPDSSLNLLKGQILAGDPAAAMSQVRSGVGITVSQQLAAAQHVGIGDTLTIPSPTGNLRMRIAATTTNFGWSPGAILMNTTEYRRYWGTPEPTALGVALQPGANIRATQRAIEQQLGPQNGLAVLSAKDRGTSINTSARAGLHQLQEISTLLVIAAVLAMATALTSAFWDRRRSLAGLRLDGAKRNRLRRILLVEATLMLSSGCLTGTVAGIYGQVAIDSYLRQATGFPIEGIATSWRPLQTLALVIITVLAIVAIPGWLAARVSPALALDD
jgi:putative ABC transport system permease protein